MTDKKYVVARAKIDQDIYGILFTYPELTYVKGVSGGENRVKGWGDNSISGRIHKIYVADPCQATYFDEGTADFLCAIFNLVANRFDSNHKFFVRSLDSLI